MSDPHDQDANDGAALTKVPRPSEAAPVHDDAPEPLRPEHLRSVRLGHGANCSSVGSVIDTLFLGAAVGGAIFAALCAAMKDEPLRVVGEPLYPTDEDEGRVDARPGQDAP